MVRRLQNINAVVCSLTCPLKWPPLSTQRNRDDDSPLMTIWPDLTDFICSKPGNRNSNRCVFINLLLSGLKWSRVLCGFLKKLWTCIICLLVIILTVRCLNITSWHSPVLGHLQIHASPVVICRGKEISIISNIRTSIFPYIFFASMTKSLQWKRTLNTCVEMPLSDLTVKGQKWVGVSEIKWQWERKWKDQKERRQEGCVREQKHLDNSWYINI